MKQHKGRKNPMPTKDDNTAAKGHRFWGIGASPGIAIGRIHLLERGEVRLPRYHIEADQCGYEVARVEAAIEASVSQLESIRASFCGDGHDHQAILEAHEMMLQDRALVTEAAAGIQNELMNAEWAVWRVFERLRSLFEQVADPYFRERRGDVDFVCDRILRNLTGELAGLGHLAHLDGGTVVVARDLSPADTAELSRHRITAFVTEVGGKTSHTSIVARSLDVPAVVGACGIFAAAGQGDLVLVDGSQGEIVLRPSKDVLKRAQTRMLAQERMRVDLLTARELPAITPDGHRIQMSGNIEQCDEVGSVLRRGGEAIGLYRTEFMFVGRSRPPGEEEHYRAYCRIFDEVGDAPVTIRTLDLGGDKLFGAHAQRSKDAYAEPNPALGLRAIRYCLAHRKIFEDQLAGLLRAGTRGNLRVMLPLISGIDEILLAKEIVAKVQDRLVHEGKEFSKTIPLGMMVEVPSAVFAIDDLASECDFFSIGTNDLLQYLLAIDRTNERVAYLYHPLHPSVLRTLKMIIDGAMRHNVPISVCGEMAGDLEQVPVLIGFGLQDLSMTAGSIPAVKRLIQTLHRKDCEQLLQQALACRTAQEVESQIQAYLKAQAPALLGWAPEDLA